MDVNGRADTGTDRNCISMETFEMITEKGTDIQARKLDKVVEFELVVCNDNGNAKAIATEMETPTTSSAFRGRFWGSVSATWISLSLKGK